MTETDRYTVLLPDGGESDPIDLAGLQQWAREGINMGLGEGTQNAKIVDTGAEELGKITGQKAKITRSTKSIAQFKLRKNLPIGAMVTLRGERMYEFLDRLISVALPRVRDFRGVSSRGFDGRGNYRSEEHTSEPPVTSRSRMPSSA